MTTGHFVYRFGCESGPCLRHTGKLQAFIKAYRGPVYDPAENREGLCGVASGGRRYRGVAVSS